MHFAPAVQVVNGNYVTAKRRGIVGGTDFGRMGQVRFVQSEALQQQLSSGNIVLLTNIGVSASGELLNCNVYDVSLRERLVFEGETPCTCAFWVAALAGGRVDGRHGADRPSF